METAHRYRASAEEAARGASPRYEEFALGVAEDRDVLAFLSTLPELKRQPNLLFAAVKYLAGVPPDYGAFHDFVIGHMDELRQLMRTRSTQTNEPGRCAVLLPLLASLRQPIALLEVGAAAGLCLLCDRYGYDHEGHRVGPQMYPSSSRATLSVRCHCLSECPESSGGVEWTSILSMSPIPTRPRG